MQSLLNTFYIFIFLGNMEHLSAIKKNLNCNIPKVKLQNMNMCKYKTLNQQKPCIIKSEILLKKIKIVNKHIQEKSEISSKKDNFPGKKI